MTKEAHQTLLEQTVSWCLNAGSRLLLPPLCRRLRNHPEFLQGRLGNFSLPPTDGQEPRIWFHAASVGEVNGAIPVLHLTRKHLPQAFICLSVGTPQGYEFAGSQLPHWARVIPFPVDVPWIVEKSLREIRPNLYVGFESEFWPVLLGHLRQAGVPALLLNGRLSRRSAQRYGFLRPLFQPLFQHFRWMAMHSEEDRQNLLTMGVSPERTLVVGSSKYDGLRLRVRPEAAARWREIMRFPENMPVVLGGSLRRSECTGLLEVFYRIQKDKGSCLGIFAPRHLHHIPAMAEWLDGHGVPFQMLSDIERERRTRNAPVVLVDRIGILFELYAVGDLIFCGGTLEPIGGHNILEPAAWSKPAFYGPHVEKVAEEHKVLTERQGSFPVRDFDDLFQQWAHWLQHLPELKTFGENAGEALNFLCGAAEKQLNLLLLTLSESSPRTA